MLDSIGGLILDMDGVLWLGDTPMPGLVDFFKTLDDLNIRYALATNNATKTAELYSKKLASFGTEVAPDKILTSAEVTAVFLGKQYPSGTKVYVSGTQALIDAFCTVGFSVIGPDEVASGAYAPVVVVGFNPNAVYRQLAMGALLVEKGAKFVGTNPDASFPSELGPLPGSGALLAVISTATGVAPTIIGKPQPTMFEEAVQRLGIPKKHIAMVGDRLNTDIAGAAAAGLRTIMLLSGISTLADVEQSEVKPNHIFADIVELAAQLEKRKKTANG